MKKLLFLFLAFFSINAQATHLFGGDLTYVHLGGNEYQLKLVVYRDCGPSNTNNTYFDATANIAVYNVGGALQTTVSIPLNAANVSLVEITLNDPCLSVPNELCVQQAIYQANVTLPFTANGYVLSYQRCCRNNSIDNITNASNSGMTLTTQIPGTNLVNVQNSSPIFNSLPPVALCLGSNFVYDIDASDADGDSLVYSFCDPYLGGTSTSPTPNPPSAPPYNAVNWATTFSTGYPIPSSPAMLVNPVTGQITGMANQIGTYAVALCVAEYRNGILINTVRRDYQFNVVLCDPTTTAAIGLPNNVSTCVGSTVTFTNNSLNASSFSWDFGVDSLTTDTSSLYQPTFVYNTPGTYYITLITNPGLDCADTTVMSFTAYEIPTATATSNSPICAGQNLQLLAESNPGVAYAWTGPASFASNLQNPIRNNATPAFTGNYTVTPTYPGCAGFPTTISVVVYATPNANPTTSGAACVGGNIQLIGNGGLNYSYNWNGPNGFTSTVQSPTLTNVNASFEGYYYLQLTFNDCVSVVDSTWVNVLAEPATNVAYNAPLCLGDTLLLTCTEIAGATYQWTGPNGFTSSQSQPQILNASNAVAGNYSLVVTSASCPSLAANVNVNVVTPPTATITNNDLEWCAGDDLPLTANNIANGNYSWTGPNGFVSSAQSPLISNIQELGTGNYTLQIEQSGCWSLPVSQEFTIFPIPYGVISSNAPICEGENLSVSVTASTGANTQYTWNNAQGQMVGSTSSLNINPVTMAWDGNVSVQLTSNGCQSSWITQDVIIYPIPMVTFSGETSYCAGETVIINASAQVSSSLAWTGPMGFLSTGNTVTLNNAMPAASGAYSVIASANGCTSEATVWNIIVNPNPLLSITTPDSSICIGESITLTLNGAPMGYWTGALQGQSISFTPNNDVYVTVTGVDANGCSSETGIQVIVHEPWVQIDAAGPNHPQVEGWVGGYYPLSAFFVASGNCESYTWQYGDTLMDVMPSLPDTVFHIYQNPSLFLLTVIAEIDGCFAFDTISVETFAESLLGCADGFDGCPLGMIPNLVTSDGDGENDGFWIPNRFMKSWEVTIFDRWGGIVGEIKQGNLERMAPIQVWDPKDYSAGVYYYTYKGLGVDYQNYDGAGWFQVVK
jgi:hypothetical protein